MFRMAIISNNPLRKAWRATTIFSSAKNFSVLVLSMTIRLSYLIYTRTCSAKPEISRRVSWHFTIWWCGGSRHVGGPEFSIARRILLAMIPVREPLKLGDIHGLRTCDVQIPEARKHKKFHVGLGNDAHGGVSNGFLWDGEAYGCTFVKYTLGGLKVARESGLGRRDISKSENM